MNKELAQQIFDALKNGASVVSDTMTQELPAIGRQLLNWMIASDICYILISAVTFVCACRYFFPYMKKTRTEDHEDVFAFICGICGFAAIPTFMTHLFDLVKVLTAPKIVLLEYLSSLLSGRGC